MCLAAIIWYIVLCILFKHTVNMRVKRLIMVVTLVGVAVYSINNYHNYKKMQSIIYNTQLRIYECIDSDIDNKTFTGNNKVDRLIRSRISEEVNKYLDNTNLEVGYIKYDIVNISVKEKDRFSSWRSVYTKNLGSILDININIVNNTGVIEKYEAEFKESIESSNRASYIDDIQLGYSSYNKLALARTGDKVDVVISYDKEEYRTSILNQYTIIKWNKV